MYKNDARQLWKEIEWKQKLHAEIQSTPPNVVLDFFTNIFQSSHLQYLPTLVERENEIKNYSTFSNITDSNICIEEVESAVKKRGRGTSYDGISPYLLTMLPKSIMQCILKLFKSTFDIFYPIACSRQLLIPIPKKGHQISNPKLRGGAMGPILSRLYDIIMNERFQSWYVPNKHQAGFRPGEGCIIQIFSLFMLADLSHILDKGLFVGLFDYEKAFDFLNRPKLIDDMMTNNIGHRFLKAFVDTYKVTTYVPQISKNALGEDIQTSYGVTQGKSSSANVFSFFVSDMHQSVDEVNCNDFLDLFNLFQLADDTIVLAESKSSFTKKAQKIEQYLNKKDLKINEDKTNYLNMGNNDNSCRESIIISDKLQIKAVNDNEGYNWLGFWLTHTNNVKNLIKFNLKKKMYNIAKFYEWLQLNEDTPFKIK